LEKKMKVLPGIGWGDARGSMGAVTASRNKGGAYFKTKVVPTNPPSPFSAAARASVGYLSEQWQTGVNATQRDAWAAAALSHPVADVFGLAIQLSGQQLFMRVNQRIYLYTGTYLDTPPADWTVANVISAVFTVDTSPVAVVFTLDPDDGFYYVRMTPPLSVGIANFRKYLRTIVVEEAVAGALPTVSVAYVARFGLTTGSQIGKSVFAEVSIFNPVNGLISPPTIVQTIIT
jgi:hypothetical protein